MNHLEKKKETLVLHRCECEPIVLILIRGNNINPYNMQKERESCLHVVERP